MELEINPQDVKRLLESNSNLTVLDVRNAWELEICAIEKSLAIPLPVLQSRVSEIDRSRPVVVVCHHGRRSLTAAEYLRSEGYDASSMRGGIDQWAREIEPGMELY